MSAIELYDRLTPQFAQRVTHALEVLKQAAAEHPGRVVQATSLGAEDMVLTDLIARHRIAIAVGTLETGKLHTQTAALIPRIEAQYGLKVEVYRPEADAVISNQPGLALAVMVADCVPILIADRKHGAAAAIHAGWRGTCARIASTAVDAMRREFGTHPSDLIAAIGPSAGPGDYEVGESLIDAFVEAGHARGDIDRWFIRTAARPHLDLWTANRDQLVAAGLLADTIYICGLSTVSHPDIQESYRVAGENAGRQIATYSAPSGVL